MRARTRPRQPFGLWRGLQPDRTKLAHDLDRSEGQRADPAGAAFGPPRGADVLVQAYDDDTLVTYKGLSIVALGAISVLGHF